MRFKVIVEFIQDTDPGDFDNKSPEEIAQELLKSYNLEFNWDSLYYADKANTIKVSSVNYLDEDWSDWIK